MNIKTFMAVAVIALTAACAETPDVSKAAGPAADEALTAAQAADTEATNADVTAAEEAPAVVVAPPL